MLLSPAVPKSGSSHSLLPTKKKAIWVQCAIVVREKPISSRGASVCLEGNTTSDTGAEGLDFFGFFLSLLEAVEEACLAEGCLEVDE